MEQEPRGPRSIDLLTVALAVFFVSLIGIVAALMLFPNLAP